MRRKISRRELKARCELTRKPSLRFSFPFGEEREKNKICLVRLRRELFERIQAPDSKDEKGRGVARGFRKATGKKHYKRGLDRLNKMRYFCKAFDVPQSQKNVSKISADISDNALSLLKIKNY